MKTLAIIPARMGSSRFPGKPMEPILNIPMIGHVYENVKKCNDLNDVIVATCDTVIYSYISSIGGKAIMTGAYHERASDRCAEALLKLEEEKGFKYDVVVMVQGDEPMTSSNMISEALFPFHADNSVNVVNLTSKIDSIEEFEDRNCIKVVMDVESNAIYFSREPIPTRSKVKDIPMFKQVCVIPFKRDFLLKYTSLNPTPLEIAESVDMMRVLEHGYKVKMVETKSKSYSVDTVEDLKRVEKIMKEQQEIL
jgi:3-deoxy-manno-octulosonate cytidylyltransferase (CMP-KDO synthetase)